MKIAFLGSRGIPRCYSGFETFVEELSVRLVQRGHEVTVYNRIPFNKYRKKEFKGVRIICLPTIPTKTTDTIVHTTLSLLHALFADYNICYFCGVGNSILSFIPKLIGTKTLVNVDGADHARAKWSRFGSWWLKKSEKWASSIADVIIADHPVIKKKYLDEYNINAQLIPYGAHLVEEDPGSDVLNKYGLRKRGYYLYVSRLTPENFADLAMKAHLKSEISAPLVVVGDAPYQTEYKKRLHALVNQGKGKILMTGYVFGNGYEQLSYHAKAFIYPTAIDATRPVVLDQMGFGNGIIARDTEANREVVGDAGEFFSPEDSISSLASAIKKLENSSDMVKALSMNAKNRVRDRYDWEKITDEYEKLFCA
ncbi:MAG: DUF1972 domain-containing protein [Verrucomicrobiota bacterium]